MTEDDIWPRFILDMSECEKVPHFLEGITRLPVKASSWEADFDLIEDEMDSDVVDQIRKALRMKQGSLSGNVPVGFYMQGMPDRAKLIRERKRDE